MNFRSPRKSLGQHFLRDQRVVDRIVAVAGVDSETLVLEIGPGRGALTQKLVTVAGGVVAVEVDQELADYLRITFSNTRFVIHHADILSCNLPEVLTSACTELTFSPTVTRVVANLPYNLSSPILERLVAHRNLFTDMTVMLQREVVERISSPAGNKTYGYFSVVLQAYCDIKHLFDVPPGAFSPPPKVWSSIVKLTPRPVPLVAPQHEAWFFRTTSAAFSQRRKTLSNALAGVLPGDRSRLDDCLRQAGIDPQQRAETLSVPDFARLAACLSEA
ncbi:MAG TPA: 16S rRNA (adenine(1518)-N(6)/adenine(1519)-N(6))-dimethyltransferase RsmA [Acidobacteriota bacterium]|nr:16S rRNA (adenine(1518)-N(6)/adenine(1519)-N(6))-dimethyltransferase RsmA [Acidobacteriota bacterium]